MPVSLDHEWRHAVFFVNSWIKSENTIRTTNNISSRSVANQSFPLGKVGRVQGGIPDEFYHKRIKEISIHMVECRLLAEGMNTYSLLWFLPFIRICALDGCG